MIAAPYGGVVGTNLPGGPWQRYRYADRPEDGPYKQVIFLITGIVEKIYETGKKLNFWHKKGGQIKRVGV